MNTLTLLLLGLLMDLWNFVSSNVGLIVAGIVVYIALKDLDRVRNEIGTLRHRVSKLEGNKEL